MKHAKFPILLLVLIFSLLLSSCAFVKYTPYEDQEKRQALSDTRNEYIEKLQALSNSGYYTEPNRTLYELALQDAINELNECKNIEALEEIFSRHSLAIEAIPQAIILVKKEALATLETHASPSDYREAERQLLADLIESYRVQIQNVASTDEVDSLLRLFKTEVYELKTDAIYYAEELDVMKAKMKAELPVYKNPALYREPEQKAMETLIASFVEEIETLSTKEEADALYAKALADLDSLPTDAVYYQREKEALIDDWLVMIADYGENYDLTPDTDRLKNTLATLSTKEEVRFTCASYLFDLAVPQEKSTLPLLKSMATIMLENLLLPDNYWEDDQKEIKAYLNKEIQALQKLQSASALSAHLEAAKTALMAYPTSEDRWHEADEAFLTTLKDAYKDAVLTAPKSLTEASSYEELAAIIDYYAFYQTSYTAFLRDTFRVKLNYPHKTAQFEINEVYWYCELIRSAVGITGYFEKDGDSLVIKLIPYAIATESNTDTPIKVDRYTSLVEFDSDRSGYQKRDDNFEDFPYLQYGKALEGIWNTQQLWYALEHEYLPITVPDSPADKALERAKEILREIVYEGMSPEEKLFAIFSWFSNNVTYDKDYGKYLYPADRKHFPDSLAAKLKSFHVEGALFENYAVCCSFAKAYLLLLRIEGVEAYRIFVHKYTDNAIDNLGLGGYGSHAFIAFRASDGKFYYSDTEQAYHTTSTFLVKHFHLLMPPALRNPYETGYSNIYKDFVFGEAMPALMTEKLVFDRKSIVVKSQKDLSQMLDAFEKVTESEVQFSVFSTPETAFSIKDTLNADGRFAYKTFTYGGVTEYMIYK